MLADRVALNPDEVIMYGYKIFRKKKKRSKRLRRRNRRMVQAQRRNQRNLKRQIRVAKINTLLDSPNTPNNIKRRLSRVRQATIYKIGKRHPAAVSAYAYTERVLDPTAGIRKRWSVAVDNFWKDKVCRDRKQRREVLFARNLRSRGKGHGRKPNRTYNLKSLVRC